MKRKLFLLLCALLTMIGVQNVKAQDAGTYYIQNVSTGKWLAPGNDWGTQASALSHADYWKLAKISNGVYTLESVVSNGGTNYYLNGTYCDGAATNFTFSAVAGKANTYTIANGSGGLLTVSDNIVNVSGSDATAEVSQWKLWSIADMSAGMAAATSENPFDATFLIKDHDLGRNNRDYSSWSNTNATAPRTTPNSDWGNKDGAAKNGSAIYSIEAFKKTFEVKQTLADIPNGRYALRVNGFYRQDGTNTDLPYLYAGSTNVTLPVRTGTENDMQAAAVSFVNGNYLSDRATTLVTNNSLTVGVKTVGNSCWAIFKNFHLEYYGNAVSYYSPVKFTSGTQATGGEWKYYDVDEGWYKIASDAAITFYYSQDDSEDADGTKSTSISQNGYTYLKLAEGKLYFKSSADATLTLTEGFVANDDITAFLLTNPNFTGNADGWEGSPDYKSKNAEKYNTTFDVYQTVSDLPAGYYRVKAQAFDRQTDVAATYESPTSVSKAYLYAGNASKLVKRIYDDASTTRKNGGTDELSFTKGETTVYIPSMPGAGEKYFDAGLYDNELLMYHGGGDLRIGIKKYVISGRDWCLFDNFRIVYAGSTPSDGADMTSLISNPSFETGNTDGWHAGSDAGIAARSTQGELSNKVGTYYALVQKNGTRSIYQDINSVPAGKYILSVNARAANTAGNVTLNMGSFNTPMHTGGDASVYTVAFENEDVTNARISIAGSGGDGSERRVFFDNFTLTYYETLPDVSITDLTSSAMSADVRAALDAANTAYTGSKTVANYNALQTAIVNAKVSIADFAGRTGADADWTDAISNPSFETGNLSGWTNVGSIGTQSNDAFDPYKSGTYYAEKWHNSGSKSVKQSLILSAGTYKITAAAHASNDVTSPQLLAGSSVVAVREKAQYDVYFKSDGTEAIEIGFGGTCTGSSWIAVDNFRLTYNPTLPVSISAVEGKMKATVASEQAAAVDAYNATSGQTIDNMVDAQAAIYAAQLSKQVYDEIATIRDNYQTKADALDAAGQAAYTAAINVASSGALTQYTEGTYTNTSEAEAAFCRDYGTALKAQTTPGTDLSELITNTNLYGKEFFNTTGDVNQTITSLSNGYYLITAQAYYRAGDKRTTGTAQNAKLYGNTTEVSVVNINTYTAQNIAPSNGGSWIVPTDCKFYVPDDMTAGNYAIKTLNAYHNSVAVNVTNGTLTLGIKKGSTIEYDWTYWDNFKLIYLGESLPATLTGVSGDMNSEVFSAQESAVAAYNAVSGQTVANYNAAANAIIAAEASISLYNKISEDVTAYGEEAATLDAAGQTAYSNEVASVNSKYSAGSYTSFGEADEELSAALLAAVKSQGAGSNWTKIITNPSFENSDMSCWTFDNITNTGDRRESGGGSDGSYHGAFWKENYNSASDQAPGLHQSVTLPAGFYRLEFDAYNHNGSGHTWKEVQLYFGATESDKLAYNTPYKSWRTFGFEFEVTETTTANLGAKFTPTENGSIWEHVDNFRLTYLGNASATMQVSGTAKMGTFCAPFNVAIPEGVTAYEASMSSDNWVHLEEIEDGVIDAGTPVILSITADDTFSQTFYGVNTAEDPDDSGVLKGLYVAETKTSGEKPYYIMQYYDSKTAFFRVPTGQSRNLGANRCYLQPESNLTPARIAIGGEDDDFTAIDELKAIEAEAKTMKDGKYLVKGRIVIVKNGKAFDANGQKLK